MKTVKMSLATIQGKLSRAEMKNIMAGSGDNCGSIICGSNHQQYSCSTNQYGKCHNDYCNADCPPY
jgi:hypothetical protein